MKTEELTEDITGVSINDEDAASLKDSTNAGKLTYFEMRTIHNFFSASIAAYSFV